MYILLLAIAYVCVSAIVYAVLYHLYTENQVSRRERANYAEFWPLWFAEMGFTYLFRLIENELDLISGEEEDA